MPIKVIQTAARAGLSALLCVCPHTVLSANKCSLAALLSVSMWKFTSTRLAGRAVTPLLAHTAVAPGLPTLLPRSRSGNQALLQALRPVVRAAGKYETKPMSFTGQTDSPTRVQCFYCSLLVGITRANVDKDRRSEEAVTSLDVGATSAAAESTLFRAHFLWLWLLWVAAALLGFLWLGQGGNPFCSRCWVSSPCRGFSCCGAASLSAGFSRCSS